MELLCGRKLESSKHMLKKVTRSTEVFAPACDPDGDPADISYGSLPVHLFDVEMSR